MKGRIISLLGPTASGKTKLSLEVASHFATEIISADSRQFYKELDIGVAKPSLQELNTIKHHFINSHSIHKPLSAGEFAKQGLPFCLNFLESKKELVLVGGSGLYADALLDGLDDLPHDKVLQKEINELYEVAGIDGLLARINAIDESSLRKVDIHNPRRLIRLLELLILSKNKFENNTPVIDNQRNFSVERFYINWNRQDLYDRINFRVDEMLKEGLENEVWRLIPYKNSRALQTVGYKEFFDYFDGELSRQDAISKIKQHTRNYAKRQLTWLNKYDTIFVLDPYSNISLLNQVLEKLD